ncbi:krab-a domain-containing protein [Vairimorpha apis BRL 01]|uniref:Krab-a domain-containing protein n=1 Tax=Vairimorpha apis BRL 01 TaxID=1037528 RepID=T0LDD3_9MICR|nr:krab-a domain-containing protein [Vairimorpha apis BRL 01]
MYAVFWGVKKFEYELRGRKFKIETDHKALGEIRNKPDFKNARITRWAEKIKEFDFEINYRAPEEMIVADSLSRIYTKGEDDKMRKINARRDRQVEGKLNKHLKSEDGIKKWIFDSGLEREIPEEENRKKLILDCHVELSHRSGTTVYYELRKKYYWPGIKDQIREALKECETCQKYNRKTSGGSDFYQYNQIFREGWNGFN